MELIKVSDKLPENGQYVLGFDGDLIICKFIQTTDKRHKKRAGQFQPTDCDWIEEVTHWMQLPEPPKSDK